MFGNRIAQILPEVSHRNFARKSRDSSRMSSSISSPKNAMHKTVPFLNWSDNGHGNSLMQGSTDSSEKQTAENNGVSAIEASNQPDLRKTRMCPNVLSASSCPFSAEKCRFAHSAGDLRVSIDKFYKIQPCAFFERGKCRNGGFCRFAHGSTELRPSVKDDTVLIGVGIYPQGGHKKHASCASYLQSPREVIRPATETSNADKESMSPALSNVCDDRNSECGVRVAKSRTEASRTNDIVSILSLQQRRNLDIDPKRIQPGINRNSISLLGEIPSSSSLSTVPSGDTYKYRNKFDKLTLVNPLKFGSVKTSAFISKVKSPPNLYINSDGHTTPSTANIDISKGILSAAYTPMEEPVSFNDAILSSRSTPTATDTNSQSEDVSRIFSSPLPCGGEHGTKSPKQKRSLVSDLGEASSDRSSGFHSWSQSQCGQPFKAEYILKSMTTVYED